MERSKKKKKKGMERGTIAFLKNILSVSDGILIAERRLNDAPAKFVSFLIILLSPVTVNFFFFSFLFPFPFNFRVILHSVSVINKLIVKRSFRDRSRHGLSLFCFLRVGKLISISFVDNR